MGIQSYRDLLVWQKAMRVAAEAYRLRKLLPKAEQYRLTSQLLRAAASVPANIAEGHARGTRKDYAHFVSIARGSLAETETILGCPSSDIARRLGYSGPDELIHRNDLVLM